MIISVKLHQLLSLPRCLLRFLLNLPNKVGRLIVLAPFLIKSLKRSRETFCFCSILFSSSFFFFFFVFFFFFFFFTFFFFPPNFCPYEFSVTTGRILLKFINMVDTDVKLCNRVSNSKCWTQRLAHGRAQNRKILSGQFLTNH